MTPTFLLLLVLLAACAAYVVRSERAVRISAVVGALIAAAYAWFLVFPGVRGASQFWPENMWHTDGLSALLILLVSTLYLTATLVSSRYIKHEHEEGVLTLAQVRLYFCLLHVFVFTMLLALLADNVVLIWIALEGTTLSTTMLVALYRKDASIEAAWKYIMLCSTGISLGLVGVLMTSYAATISGSTDASIFSLQYLQSHASSLSPEIMRWAFIFLFIGLGTKVGFVPMHTWLPDAHSKTPSPISAMLSGILLNVALYAIIRFKFITDGALGTADWTNWFFLIFGLLSVLVPAFILLIQRNYKRMLAYSSVEHMGLTAFAIGLGPLGFAAALMHMIGHMIVKSALFFSAGEILLRFKTTKIEQIKNLMQHSRFTATLFLVGILAIVAAPPTVLFASEFMLFRSGFAVHPWLSLTIIFALTLVLIGMVRPTINMVFVQEAPADSLEKPTRQESWNGTHTIITVHLLLAAALGIWFMTADGSAFITQIVQLLPILEMR